MDFGDYAVQMMPYRAAVRMYFTPMVGNIDHDVILSLFGTKRKMS
jgi:hypothetical protein